MAVYRPGADPDPRRSTLTPIPGAESLTADALFIPRPVQQPYGADIDSQ